MTDKALEAAADTAIVAKAMACSEWPKWLFDLIELTNRAADEADMSTEQAVAFAVLSYLSALPGEAEVVGLIERLRSPVSMSQFATKTDLYMEVLGQRREALGALQAMQARAEKAEEDAKRWEGRFFKMDANFDRAIARAERAERERDEAREIAANFTQVERYTAMQARAEAAEARVKELEEQSALVSETLQSVINYPQGDLWNYATTPTAKERLIWAARVEVATEISALMPALTGGSNG